MNIKKVEEFAKKFYDKYEKDSNIWNHIKLVRKYALELVQIENADKEVVEVAALLHDIGKCKEGKPHSEISYDLAKNFIENSDLNKKDLILKCILKHSKKYSSEDNEIEVKIIQSADALGTLFDDKWQEFSIKIFTKEKLLKLYERTLEKINLQSARKIAEPKLEELKKKL